MQEDAQTKYMLPLVGQTSPGGSPRTEDVLIGGYRELDDQEAGLLYKNGLHFWSCELVGLHVPWPKKDCRRPRAYTAFFSAPQHGIFVLTSLFYSLILLNVDEFDFGGDGCL